MKLAKKEFMILGYLLRNKGQVLSRNQILEHVWDYSYDGLSNVIETYVKYLRKKLKAGPEDKELIYTMRGSGYILKAGSNA
ncbi:MAG: winged helix-turn-helix domain-containing protein [Candidatus Humimicrobiaceae bacterium]